ncbi:trafficking protein particle complex subunit 10 [Gymnopilus junonius]|uniref:Trafficking protein particle complex subunit 10 n=1 Tax=Gymnopilus junonius TaxID=109634 RepID=A0A9P5P0Q1_GYMJU|nr:trafficking protein particle complex subunit 10 [Gymnopilus junonius]
MSSSSSSQRALISFTAPPLFLASPNWNKVHAALLAQLPLRNIHWKAASRGSVKTIQELDVSLVPFEALRDEHTQVPVTLLEKPLLHIYIVHCEDSDQETYRTTLKKLIKDWHTSVTSRKNQEWLILQIIRPDPARQAGGNFFQIKGSVLDKLKTDFNSDKRDRVVQINWATGNDTPLVWAEFVNRMKEGLIFAFDAAIDARQEEVKRSDNQQSMPGWNFCTFFILKESLAASFEGMNLFDEALIPYDELETLFYKVSKEKNMSWFGSLIQPNPQEDLLPLLSLTRKSYRDLILANTISVFDFRIYLLARQCQLLAKLGRLSEITTKVGYFLCAFGERLREVESTLPPLFIESWIYSSALSAVEQISTWTTSFKVDTSKSGSANAGKGELLDLARSQLDVVGIEAGHLPRTSPFSISLISSRSLPVGTKLHFSNESLDAAVNAPEAFYKLYVAVTNRAIDLYAKSGRRKFALKLHGNLAALELHRGNLTAALNTFTSLPAHYAPHLWTSLESFMLSRALDTHANLDTPKNVEWIHIVLSFLKTYVEHPDTEMLIHEADKVDYVTRLVGSLRTSVENLESDLAHPDHPVISIKVSSHAKLAETWDGSFVDVVVTNHLPCAFPVDEISVIVIGRDSEKFRYTSKVPSGCPSGKSTFTLFCSTSKSGSFLLESTEVRSARLLLQWTYRKASSKSTQQAPLLVRVPSDPLALNVRISQSNRIELGKPQSLMVVVSSGRNKIGKLTIRLTSPSVSFRCQEAVLSGVNQAVDTFNAMEGGINIEDVEDDSDITFLVPHSDASTLAAMKVNLEVEYVTVDEPSITRIANFSRILITTLPISVNVEDFFRGTRLISKFTVSTTSHQHVRISDARLDLPPDGLDGVTIQPAMKKRRVVTVTPVLPANFLFSLDSSNGPVRESLTLNIKYRMLREEVESIIESEVRTIIEENDSSPHHRITVVSKLIDALESDAAWVDMYGITGELNVPEPAKLDKQSGEISDLFKERLAEHRHPESPIGFWREIKIPVDVPFMNVVAAASIRIISTPFAKESEDSQLSSLYAGQPISANLTIQTTFHWGSTPSDTNKEYLLRFNIEEMVREWLVSGPKRGDFIAKDGATHTVPITLIALHHGEFSLPKVTVAALPIAGTITMGSMAVPSIETYQAHGAEKVLVLPRGGRTTFVVGMGPG